MKQKAFSPAAQNNKEDIFTRIFTTKKVKNLDLKKNQVKNNWFYLSPTCKNGKKSIKNNVKFYFYFIVNPVTLKVHQGTEAGVYYKLEGMTKLENRWLMGENVYLPHNQTDCLLTHNWQQKIFYHRYHFSKAI